jgi:putative tricarboxylic transport membrane protein
VRKAHIGLGLLVTALGAFALAEGSDLDVFGEHGVPGPGFFPILISGALVVLGIMLTASSLVRQPVPSTGSGTDEPAGRFDLREMLRVGRVWIGFTISVPLLVLVGFIPAMALLVAYLLFSVERIRGFRAVLAIILTPALVYAVFAYLLGVDLPTGLLFGQP